MDNILECIHVVEKELGKHYKENIYQYALYIELNLRGYLVQTEVMLPIHYKGVYVGPKNKVHGLKKGDTWTNPNAKKSDAQKRADAKRKKYENATPEERKKMQDAANDKADKFHKRGKYKENKK